MVQSFRRRPADIHARTLPDGLEAELWLESRRVQLPPRSAPTDLVPAQPQVVVMASGDLIPFELRLRRGGTEEVRAVIGRTDGTLETLANDEVTDR